jgi:hypothetical protein
MEVPGIEETFEKEMDEKFRKPMKGFLDSLKEDCSAEKFLQGQKQQEGKEKEEIHKGDLGEQIKEERTQILNALCKKQG